MPLFRTRKTSYEEARAAIIARYSAESMRESAQIRNTVRLVEEVGEIAACGDRARAAEAAHVAFADSPIGSPAGRPIVEQLISGDSLTVLAELFEAIHDGHFDKSLRAFAKEYRLSDLGSVFDSPLALRRIEGICFGGLLSKYMPVGVFDRCIDDMRDRARDDHFLNGFIEGAVSAAPSRDI